MNIILKKVNGALLIIISILVGLSNNFIIKEVKAEEKSNEVKIDDYFYEKYQTHLPHEELAYLIVHIQRLISKN